jgi:fructokinase
MSRPFVVVGESLVDIVVPAEGTPTQAVGGSPMNVAVGLARLDVPTLLITQIGNDEHGRWITEHVQASGVELADTSIRPDLATSTATAQLDPDQQASYEFDLTWDLAHHTLPDEVLGLHVGSLGATLRPGRTAVLDLVRQAQRDDVFVSYDPNIRPAFVDEPGVAWREMVHLASSARLVKVSEEDLQTLRFADPVEDLARALLVGATELVIVTSGAAGSTAFTEGTPLHVPAPRVDVVDTVGAGDSYMAAALAILHDWGLTTAGPGALAALDADHTCELLAGAMAAASLTCSRRGANPPTRRELPPTWPAV